MISGYSLEIHSRTKSRRSFQQKKNWFRIYAIIKFTKSQWNFQSKVDDYTICCIIGIRKEFKDKTALNYFFLHKQRWSKFSYQVEAFDIIIEVDLSFLHFGASCWSFSHMQLDLHQHCSSIWRQTIMQNERLKSCFWWLGESRFEATKYLQDIW